MAGGGDRIWGRRMELGCAAPAPRWERPVRAALFIIWCLAVAFLASRHTFWRDEVRAFTIALSGDNLAEMLRNLHGEGHPAVWYLLLRGAHSLVPVREVLPVTAGLVAAAAVALLAFRSPFRASVIALIMFGAFALFEYAVMARNYGISMLLLFALADRYRHWRDRGIGLGVLLALLCNTNVLAVFMAAGFLIVWLADIIGEEGLRWTRKHWLFLANAAVAAIGAAASFATVYPSAHDAITPVQPTFSAALDAILNPGVLFPTVNPPLLAHTEFGRLLFPLVLVGPLLGLVRRPGAILSSLFVLATFSLFFAFVYRGAYRHEALFVVYLVAMYWIVLNGHGGSWPERWRLEWITKPAAAFGSALFVVLLAFQIPRVAALISADLRGIPASRAKDLGELLQRKQLSQAIVVGDPEVFLEPLPYYAPNPIYLVRERRFGKVVRFTRHARLRLSLDELLADAQALQAASGRPVVIVLGNRVNPNAPPTETLHTMVQTTWTTPSMVRRFDAATQKLASFGPARSRETYDVYLLRRPSG
jgi:hypothetical protein